MPLAALGYRNALAPTTATVTIAVVTPGGGGRNVACAGGPLPGTPVTLTFQNRLGKTNVAAFTTTDSLTGGTSPATAITTTTAGSAGDGIHYALDDSQTDGRQTAKGILMFPSATDASGNITQGTASGGGYHGETLQNTPMWMMGFFRTNDCVGLTDAAIAQMGRLVEGSIAAGGVFSIGL